jgi:hypothetical protein
VQRPAGLSADHDHLRLPQTESDSSAPIAITQKFLSRNSERPRRIVNKDFRRRPVKPLAADPVGSLP